MSAPTALDRGALTRRIARARRSVDAPATRSGPEPGQPDRRATDPLSLLGRAHDTLCVQAADPDEIAAVLEAAGIDDRVARDRYGLADTFQVAEQLWSRVPWRAAAEQARRDLWELPLWRALLRGLVYVVPPALATGAVAGDGPATAGSAAVLLLATVLTIAAGQALSVLGHLLLGRGDPEAVSALLRSALAAVTGCGLVVAGLTAAFRGPTGAVLAATGQALFVAAATVLVVRRRDGVLAASVGGGLLLVLGAAAGRGGPDAWLLTAAAAATVGLPVCAALLTGPRPRGGSRRSLAVAVGRPELAVTRAAARHGLGLAALAAAPVLAATRSGMPLRPLELTVLTLPLSATLGLGEYLLHRARRQCLDGMRRARALTGFASVSVRELRLMAGRQVVAAAAAAAVAGVLLPPADRQLWPVVVVYAVLAVALLLVTTLLSLGETTVAARLTLTAGALALPVAGLAPAGSTTARDGLLAIALGLLLAAWTATAPRFARTAVHR